MTLQKIGKIDNIIIKNALKTEFLNHNFSQLLVIIYISLYFVPTTNHIFTGNYSFPEIVRTPGELDVI
ncbi:hypothetical protein V1477_008147 [Vespula maculifrons]|uniref:Uncharacterized protein n=1 Tax=Vespula maculifrons TaxID=7453 RepID=A0ABD2CC64_VESMC